MELGIVHSLLSKNPQQAAALTYTFLGGVIYTITVFPQDLPAVLLETPVRGFLVRSATYLPVIFFMALAARYQQNASRGRQWSMSEWHRNVMGPMMLGLGAGALGGHLLALE